MRKSVVKVICAANGTPTPHDGRYVIAWNPHTKAGILELSSTHDINKARIFENSQEFVEWKTQSKIQPIRPWDGKPNRPLTAITIESVHI